MNSYTFIHKYDMLNEINNYYKTKVNYKEIFDNLDEELKNDLSYLTDILHNFFTTELTDKNHSSFYLDGTDKIDTIDIRIQIFFNSLLNDTYKISMIVMCSNNYASSYNNILQNICITFSNFDEDFKNAIYNLLFFSHVVTRYFKYNPLFYSLQHNDDLKNMIEIRKKNIKLFGSYNECCVCLEQTIKYTLCNHYLCQKCYLSLIEKKCPLCRRIIDINDEDEYEEYD